MSKNPSEDDRRRRTDEAYSPSGFAFHPFRLFSPCPFPDCDSPLFEPVDDLLVRLQPFGLIFIDKLTNEELPLL
jgi:hypothetical protein